MHEDLLGIARQLALLDIGKPRQATLRRAISTAYYALFHALCDACVRQTVGWRRRRNFWEATSPIYRSIDHGAAKRLFSQIRSNRHSSDELRRLAEYFIALQDGRLRADYDPAARFIRARTLEYINEAQAAIRLLDGLEAEARLELVVMLLTKPR